MLFNEGYQIRNQAAIHFVTFTVVGWIDVFSRREYREILTECLRFCRANKGLRIYACVIMSNHAHPIISARDGNLSDVIRDCKKFTSRQMLLLAESDTESRRLWMLHQFKYFASRHQRNEKYQVWTHGNHPEEIFTPAFMKQKMDYVHQNPVRAGIVHRQEDYVYSSASNYAGLESVIEIDLL